MYSSIIKRGAGLLVLALILSTAVFAQTSAIEGTVKVRAADGTTTPVAGAIVDIYRRDVKGHWEVKTDKAGHYVRLGMPLTGTYLVVASGPGMQPTWVNGARLGQSPIVDLVANPGDGMRPTLEQVLEWMAQQSRGGPSAPAAVSEADRAKAEAAKKDYEAKVKESQALQGNFDQARAHFLKGVELKNANSYQEALAEFAQATNVDPTKHAAFLELAYKANAQIAETHYQMGVELFNQKKRDEAKAHFQKAMEAANKAVEYASTDTANANINNDLVIYYNIVGKNAALLVEHYGMADLVDPTVKTLDKAETIDAANKNKWIILKANMYRFAGRSDDAVAAYKSVLAAEPNNLDAIYNMGLTLLASAEKEKLQEAANALAEFVAKAPADDKRIPEVKSSLEVLKNEFKVEAEKPSRRRGRP
jgi:tetratricopeptide (TPR) repeat protein